MKATLTFVTLFFAILSSVSASPLPRRDTSDLLDQLTQLSSVANTFNDRVPADGGILNIDILLDLEGILLTVPDYYADCNSALANTPQLSDDDAQKVISQYADSSSTFSHGFNRMASNQQASNQQNSSAGSGLNQLLIATGNAISSVGDAAGNFASNLGGALNGNNQAQNQVEDTNSRFQNSVRNAKGSL